MASSEHVNIFQKAREDVEKNIDRFVLCLNQKKLEMFSEILTLETEHNNKQKQIQNDIQRLVDLKSQTEELGRNNLVAVQQKIIENIQTGINNLNLESNVPEFNIEIEWKFCLNCFEDKIKDSNVVKAAKVQENSENTTLYPLVSSPTSSLEEDIRLNSLRESDRDSEADLPNPRQDAPVTAQGYGYPYMPGRGQVSEDWGDEGWDDVPCVDPVFDPDTRPDGDLREYSWQANDPVPKCTFSNSRDRVGFGGRIVETEVSAEPKKQKKRRNRRRNRNQEPEIVYVKNLPSGFQPEYVEEHVQPRRYVQTGVTFPRNEPHSEERWTDDQDW